MAAPAKKKRIIKSRQSLAEKKTGTTLFPMARVKKIIKADQDLNMMSTEATFLVAVATVSVSVASADLRNTLSSTLWRKATPKHASIVAAS